MTSSSNSERQPLLPQHAPQQAQQTAQQAASKAKQYVPSKETRFSIAKAYGALQAGKLPSTQQLDKLIEALINSDVFKPSSPGSRTVRLSDQGARTVEDLKELLKELRNLADEKNGDDKIQEFLYNTLQVDFDVDVRNPATVSSRSKRQAQVDAQKGLESLRTIGQLVITSTDFRSLVSEFVLLGRDIFADAAAQVADAASTAADKARPSEKEREEGVDWQKVEARGKKTKQAYESGRLQGDAQSRAGRTQEQLRQYFDEKLPASDEAKDRLIENLKKIAVQTQKHPEYRESIQTIVTLIQKWFNTSKSIAQSAVDGTKVKDEDEHAQEAMRQLRGILETFAGGKSLDGVIESAKKVFQDVQNDDRLSKYFDDVAGYVDRILYDEGYATTNRAYQRGSALYDRAQDLISGDAKWKADAQTLQTELESFVDAVKDDEATERVLDKASDVSEDLSNIASVAAAQLRAGGIGLLRDAFDVILPRLVAAVKEIPLPRTEYKSEDIDLAIDGLVFESASFIPDNIRFVTHNDLSMTQGFAAYSTDLDSSVRLHVDGLRLSAKDISYWFHKKTGYFAYEDSGLLDISLDGSGLSFDVKLENAPEEARETFFVVSNVHLDLSALQFSVRENNHWFLTFFGKPFMRSLIESNLTVLLEGQITEYLKTLDLRLFALQQRAIAATNARPSSPADYFRAIFSSSALPSLPTMGGKKFTQRGIIKAGPRGAYLLAIGVDEQLFPGKAGGGDAYEHRKDVKDTVKRTVDQARDVMTHGASASAANGSEAVARARNEAEDVDRVRRGQYRAESRKDGWKSDAFDIGA